METDGGDIRLMYWVWTDELALGCSGWRSTAVSARTFVFGVICVMNGINTAGCGF